MSASQNFPVFEDCFHDLNQFILELVHAYGAGRISSWDELENEVKSYFADQRMEQMESRVPGWQEMASYSEGITLVHVMCVFLGLFMLPEFQSLSVEQQQLAKWIVLFHDVAKAHIQGKKDTMHAFRSAVQTAKILPDFGFPTTQEYPELIGAWSEYTTRAFLDGDAKSAPKPDNGKLPEILKGIEQLYGAETPATLIIKTVLLHISLDVDPYYPTPAPLTEEEIRHYIGISLLPLLGAMMLSDNEGWSLFDPETRARQRKATLQAFEQFGQIISG